VKGQLDSHGLNAHPRRRDEIARIYGLSLPVIREYLLDNVPGLRESFVLDLSTIHHWMKSPRDGTYAAAAYKNFLRARTYSVENNERYIDENVCLLILVLSIF
jgi:hypothetical protein